MMNLNPKLEKYDYIEKAYINSLKINKKISWHLYNTRSK